MSPFLIWCGPLWAAVLFSGVFRAPENPQTRNVGSYVSEDAVSRAPRTPKTRNVRGYVSSNSGFSGAPKTGATFLKFGILRAPPADSIPLSTFP